MVHITKLKACSRTRHWPYNQIAYLFGEDPAELLKTAESVDLKARWIHYSKGFSYFEITERQHLRLLARWIWEMSDDQVDEFMISKGLQPKSKGVKSNGNGLQKTNQPAKTNTEYTGHQVARV